MTEQLNLVPKRRFKEFQNTQAWEQRNWEETVDISTNMVDPRTGSYDELLHIGPGNIESFTGRILDNVLKVKDSNLISGKFHFYKDDIIYGKIRPQLGKYAIAPFEGLASADTYILNTKNGVVQNFLYSVLQTNDFYGYSVSVSARTGMPKINRDELNVYNYNAPKMEEQAKIGYFFVELDQLITLHQRKLEKTKALKSAYLSEMFPAEGECEPKRRFAGFSYPWERRQLGDMGEPFTGLSGKTKEDFGHGSAEFVIYMNVFSNPISDTSMTEHVEVDSKQNELKYGDVLFTTSSETPQEVGMSSVWLGNRPNVYLNSFCFGYRPTVNVDFLFLAYLLRSNTVRKQMMLLAQGISRYNISKNKVMELAVGLPDIQEQEKIGNLFKHLDHTIALHQRKLEKLQNLKKAYLNEMFI